MPLSEQGLTPSENNRKGENSSRFSRRVRLARAIALMALLFAVAGLLWWWSYPDKPGPPRAETVIVDIPKGTGVAGIAHVLTGAGVVEDDIRFVLLVKVLGASRRLKAGEYAFAPGMTPRAVLDLLTSGKVVQHAITLPEGLTVAQVAEVISDGGWGSREDFLRLAADPGILARSGVEQITAEGYLFPDTYFFAKGTSLQTIITAMLRRMDLVLAEEGVGREIIRIALPVSSPAPGEPAVAPSSLLFSRHEVLTLASIIEKETALPDERPLVARVFLNRLRVGMKLQADPTVVYGLAKFGSPLTKGDLKTPNPYNTYVNRGLPIGPICNPSRTAIAAVVRPSPEDYYYFVANGDGTHYFAKTLADHNRAVSRYRKKRLSNRE